MIQNGKGQNGYRETAREYVTFAGERTALTLNPSPTPERDLKILLSFSPWEKGLGDVGVAFSQSGLTKMTCSRQPSLYDAPQIVR